jgi:Uma2 family endonuclease
LGHVTPPDAVYDFEHTGQPNTGLLPDIGFYYVDREALVLDDQPYPFAPDLAVEIASPSQKQEDLDAKARRYLAGGTSLAGKVLRMPPLGTDHGNLEARLSRRLGNYVEDHRLGETYVGEGGWDLTRPGEPADTVLGADIAFVRAEHVPLPPPRRGTSYRPLAPDLGAAPK